LTKNPTQSRDVSVQNIPKYLKKSKTSYTLKLHT
jgi:hypothetical protein